jgi:sulfopropanediol 3-dehydrogenase
VIADQIAAEHVHVHGDRDDRTFFFARLHNYGSLFLGEETTVVFGDKAIGTNHCLPTNGAARFTGGLWVGSFLKVLSYQEITQEGAAIVAPVAAAIAAAEQLDGHSRSANARTTDDRVSR